jgi:hypothetical protein
VTDTDCAILPNKGFGYDPNYTPMAAVDSHRGFIIDADVDNKGYESHTTIPAIDRIKETFGRGPGFWPILLMERVPTLRSLRTGV